MENTFNQNTCLFFQESSSYVALGSTGRPGILIVPCPLTSACTMKESGQLDDLSRDLPEYRIYFAVLPGQDEHNFPRSKFGYKSAVRALRKIVAEINREAHLVGAVGFSVCAVFLTEVLEESLPDLTIIACGVPAPANILSSHKGRIIEEEWEEMPACGVPEYGRFLETIRNHLN